MWIHAAPEQFNLECAMRSLHSETDSKKRCVTHFWKTCLLPLTPPFFFRFSSGTCILHAASVCFRLHFRLSSVFLPWLRILDNWILGFRLLFRLSSGTLCFQEICFLELRGNTFYFRSPKFDFLTRGFWALSYVSWASQIKTTDWHHM